MKGTGMKKEEYEPFYNPFFRDLPTPSENRWIALPKKAKSVPGIEPRLIGKNAVALPLAPPPLAQKESYVFVPLVKAAL